MHARQFVGVMLGLAVLVSCGGQVIGGDRTPTPAPPPTLDRPEGGPTQPQVETFAVCGPGTDCECANVVSLIQAHGGQSCTVTSSTGSCTFTSRESDVGVCCVCRP